MPELSRFFGIIITMYYDDHQPPHFHARYAEHRAAIRIGDLAVMEGNLPPRVLGLVMEWAALHRDDLSSDWDRAVKSEPLQPIAPLR